MSAFFRGLERLAGGSRRSPEQALRESEARFAQVFHACPLAVSISRLRDGLFLECNDAFLMLVGRTRAEVIGKTSERLGVPLAPADRERALELLRQQGQVQNFPSTIHTKAGVVRDVESSFVAVPVAGEECFVAISADVTERNKALQALRESEERFSTAFRAGPLAIAISRVRDGRVVEANESFLELFGYARDEVIGRTTLELGLYAEPEERARAAAVVREHGIVRSFDIKGRTKSGEMRDLLLSASAIDLEGEPCFLSSAEDVTERNQALEALRDSERRLRSTLDGMLEGCQIIGFDWRYLYVNDAVAKHGRRTKGELLGHTMMEVYPDIDDTEMFGYLRRCMEERIPHRMVNEFTYPDGAKAWFELRIEPVAEGILILSLDITDHLRAEEALRESELTLRATLDSSMDAIAVIDNAPRLLHFNTRAIEMFHLPEELLRAGDVWRLMGFVAEQLEDPAEFLRRSQEILAAGGETTDIFHAKDGRVFERYVGPLVMAGQLIGRVVNVRDITDRVRAEEALQNAREELEEKAEREVVEKNPYGLTFREFTVLHLVAAGKADKEIANELGISVLTASKHVANILAKMAAASRTEAGVRAVREGLIV